MHKAIVLFFSLSGNTKSVGKFIAKELEIPYEAIEPVKTIKSEGVTRYFWGSKQVVMHEKALILPLKANLDDYDTVFIGSTVWVANLTPPVKTLLEAGNLKGKTIALFYTHDRGVGNIEERITDSVEIHNSLLSTYDLLKVKDNFEDLKAEVLSWAKESINY